jgi:hypothetical protein
MTTTAVLLILVTGKSVQNLSRETRSYKRVGHSVLGTVRTFTLNSPRFHVLPYEIIQGDLK